MSIVLKTLAYCQNIVPKPFIERKNPGTRVPLWTCLHPVAILRAGLYHQRFY